MAGILNAGDKILVAHRRLFAGDEPRFFVGRVLAYDAGIVKTEGRSYLRDMASGNYLAKEDIRTKIFSIASGTLFVYQLAEDVSLPDIELYIENGALMMSDGRGFTLNLAERPHQGTV